MEDWKVYRFCQLVSESKDGDWGVGEETDKFAPFHVIRGTDFEDVRRGDVSGVPLRYLSEKTAWRRALRSGDILLETAGGSRNRSTGRSLLVSQRVLNLFSGEVTCASFARFLRVDSAIADPRFIYWFLQHLHLSGAMWNHQVQHTGVARFQYTRFAETQKVALPPLSVQQAIAEVLGVLDDKIALNERIRETTLSLASAYFEDADTSGDPELIGDLAELFDGPHATPQKIDTGPWFLSISSLKTGYLDLAESAHLSEKDFPRWTRRVQPQAGDVLFSYETRLGDAALMPPGVRGSLGRRMALLRSKSTSISGALLLQAYLSPAFQEEIRRRTVHGATVDRLPLKEMPNWRISLPAQGERERLSVKLDALHASVTQGANENRTLADLRDTLLPRLFSGKLRVKDAVRTVEEVV
ncbi:restriction endonuclease subunit S [Streptomyces sp. PSKA30]|uniref:restriction endonuclease subunit S n=1 Tax=Streptomyces sp. PSKA30 TaxID=2874597 RepID=UPI001CD0778C|nr:restriction endonuclease subunit S [Streptomyces sp. PSKA30]MBZ9639537.1 restriction endonuclease subunit S [Streptomyces sp. PSKA30]